MRGLVDKSQTSTPQTAHSSASPARGKADSALPQLSNRPEAVIQRKLQDQANLSPDLSSLGALQERANHSPQALQSAQLQERANSAAARKNWPTASAVESSPAALSAPALMVSPSLLVGRADDPAERQADAMADAALASLAGAGQPHSGVVSRSAAAGDQLGGLAVAAPVQREIDTARGGGSALGQREVSMFSGAYGVDLSPVRVHTDSRADGLSRSLQAHAFTTGSDVFFRNGTYKPGTESGDRLIGHELAHVATEGGAARRSMVRRQYDKHTAGTPSSLDEELKNKLELHLGNKAAQKSSPIGATTQDLLGQGAGTYERRRFQKLGHERYLKKVNFHKKQDAGPGASAMDMSRTLENLAKSSEGAHTEADGKSNETNWDLSGINAIDAATKAKWFAQASKEYIRGGGAYGTGGRYEESLKGTPEEDRKVLNTIADNKVKVDSENELPTGFLEEYERNPDSLNRLTPQQQATFAARQAGRVGTDENGKTLDNYGAFMAKTGASGKADRYTAKDKITAPERLFSAEQIRDHLGKFANGAHAFIDIAGSHKILGKIESNFKGWGAINDEGERAFNFVAPIDEATAFNNKARAANGIETLENDLGIPNKQWSWNVPNDWGKGNTEKQLMRWFIPKPSLELDLETQGILLKMATGKELNADPELWVAGGFTKGGAAEAVLDAIPRVDLLTLIESGEIKTRIETYPMTGDDIEYKSKTKIHPLRDKTSPSTPV